MLKKSTACKKRKKNALGLVFNNTLFKYIYAHKQDTRCVFEKADCEVIPIKGPLTEL